MYKQHCNVYYIQLANYISLILTNETIEILDYGCILFYLLSISGSCTISTYACTAQSWYWPFESRPCCTLKNTGVEKNVVHTYLIIVQSETSTADWIIVIGHHPVYSSGSHGSEGSTQTMYDHIRYEMVKHKVALYVCGHDHMMEHLTDRT